MRLHMSLCAVAVFVSLPARAATIVVPTIEILALGHVFQPGPGEMPARIEDAVSFPCGSELGACSGPGFSAALQNGDRVELRFAAPAGFAFSVQHLPGAHFLFYSSAWEAGVDAFSAGTTPTFEFENLSGSAPSVGLLSASVFDAGRVIRTQGLFEVTGDFAFTALALSFVVPNAPPGSLESFGPVAGGGFASFAASEVGIDATLMALVPLPEPSCLALLLTAILALRAVQRRLA